MVARRTASITGAFVALVDAVDFTFGGAGKFPITDFCAAISVGIGPEGPITGSLLPKRIVQLSLT